MSKIRTVVYYKFYFIEFYKKLSSKVQRKISWTIDIIENSERIPIVYFKHLEDTDGLYEIRIQHGSDIYRIFCFFDDGSLAVASTGSKRNHRRRDGMKLNEH